jgi:hypothetical protein
LDVAVVVEHLTAFYLLGLGLEIHRRAKYGVFSEPSFARKFSPRKQVSKGKRGKNRDGTTTWLRM